MSAPSPRRRSPSRLRGIALAAAVTLGAVAAPHAAAQSSSRGGYGPSLAERRAAVRLAQRERDAARRRSNRYTFGDVGGDVPGAALAAPRAVRDKNGVVTAVRVVVLVDGAAGVLGARRWRETLSALGVDVSLRTGRNGDELGVTETTGAGLRTVTATGRLTPNGELLFGERRFGVGDRRALGAWVGSLSSHGAAGDPAGQPLWGLSEPQFRALFQALSAPAPEGFAEVSGGPLGPALLALELPPATPVRFSAGASALLDAPGPPAPRNGRNDGPVPSFSKGAAFAVTLARRGLAFRPTRTPAGSLELTIVPRPAADPLAAIPGTAAAAEPGGEATAGAWPVGWKVEDGPGRLAAAAGLFAFTSVGVRESSLNDFVIAAGAASGVPVVLDVAALRAAGVDPATETVSVPPGRGTWGKAVRYAVAEHRLKSELRRDEAGRGFLWVTPARR